ncbi:hypothetical protein FACS18949_07720 [Clostridia bacterium]|nr:hypothetical protein FACS18949_07720 [Clostridia bacterium]
MKTDENARELKRARETLNKTIDAAEAAEKEKNETLVERNVRYRTRRTPTRLFASIIYPRATCTG